MNFRFPADPFLVDDSHTLNAYLSPHKLVIGDSIAAGLDVEGVRRVGREKIIQIDAKIEKDVPFLA